MPKPLNFFECLLESAGKIIIKPLTEDDRGLLITLFFIFWQDFSENDKKKFSDREEVCTALNSIPHFKKFFEIVFMTQQQSREATQNPITQHDYGYALKNNLARIYFLMFLKRMLEDFHYKHDVKTTVEQLTKILIDDIDAFYINLIKGCQTPFFEVQCKLFTRGLTTVQPMCKDLLAADSRQKIPQSHTLLAKWDDYKSRYYKAATEAFQKMIAELTADNASQIKALAQKQTDHRSEMVKQNRNIKKNINRTNTLKEANALLEAALTSVNQQEPALQSTLQELTTQITNDQKEITLLQQDEDHLKFEVEQLKSRLSQTQQKFTEIDESLEQEVVALEKTQRQAQKQEEANQIEALLKRKMQCERALSQTTQARQALQNRLAELELTSNKVTKETKAIQNNHPVILDQLRKKLGREETLLRQLEDQWHQLQHPVYDPTYTVSAPAHPILYSQTRLEPTPTPQDARSHPEVTFTRLVDFTKKR